MAQLWLHRILARVWLWQALYDVITGLWGMVDIRTFQMVTGPKTDRWLVKTVSALVVVIGGVIGSAGTRQKITPEVAALAVGTNVSLAAVDIVYVGKGRISKVYLLDALAGTALTVGWALAIRRKLVRLQT